jgi:MFS transporter, PHS family, inorganic phosphate transporter
VLIVYGVQTGYKSPDRQGMLFILFGGFMALGAVYSWAYIPDVARRDADTGKRAAKTLEDLGEGRAKAKREGEVITVRDKWDEVKRKGWRRSRRRGGSVSENGSGSNGHA